jgi:hypothetical protein
MRKIVLLAAASIMVAATLPVSAKSMMGMLNTCDAVGARAFHEAEKECGNDLGLLLLGLAMEGPEGAQESINYIIRHSTDNACFAALRVVFTACKAPKNVQRRVYKPPQAPVNPLPPAGLLETTPGLSPQGPAAVGTPSRPPNIGRPQ